MAKARRVELLTESSYSLDPPSGKVLIHVDEELQPKELPLVLSEEVDPRIPYTFLNPLQSAFYYTYHDGSALVSSPTSSGKSLIAHLFMKDCKGRKVYTAPTKSLVYEKAVELKRYYKVDLRTGDQVLESYKPLKGELLVCTYEYLTLSWRNSSLEDVECLVVDEVHQIIKRPVVEELLTYALERRIPVLALSATLPGDEELALWLGVGLFLKSSWRPVPLERKVQPLTEFKPMHRDLDSKTEMMASRLLNALLSLRERDEKTILFVPRKQVGWDLLELAHRERIGIMNETLPFEKEEEREPEIAFHNADVPKEEREAIEKAFREGSLNMLVATQTLAYGVNLPADRVIVLVEMYNDKRSRGVRSIPDSLDILQMEGRAGRLGIKEIGYSHWLLYGGKEERLCLKMKEDMESELKSKVKERLSFDELVMFVLLSIHYRGRDFWSFLEKTYSFGDVARDKVKKALDFLEYGHYIEGFRLTQKGLFCLSSDIPPTALEKYLTRRRINLPLMASVRPLLSKRKFDSLYYFVRRGESFEEDDLYVKGLLSACLRDCLLDNTHQFLFYVEGLLFKYPSIKNPPGDFSYLSSEALHLIKKLVSMSRVGLFEEDRMKILEVAHSVKFGVSPDFASVSGIKGIGHIRANLIKRILRREGKNLPPLGSKTSSLFEFLGEDEWKSLAVAVLVEERKLSKEKAEAEADKVLKILKNNLSGYMVDDQILLVYALSTLGKDALRMKKKELISEIFGV